MTDDGTVNLGACGATMVGRPRPGYRRPHLGRHLCVADPHPATAWHRCWCGYQWSSLTDPSVRPR